MLSGPDCGMRFKPALAKIFDARLGRRRAAGIERFDFAGFFHVDQSEQIAARTAGFRLDHGHDKRRGERRIDGVAAFAQNIDTG